ncbi:Cof-type HAD-IIB family hydrolase [Kocuria carniphila]|uniref:Cof-type HAD-IIB family hydrolase n=1 Tax=Kocuria carniphila TaxID=262208 RepID=UPI0021A6ECE3|nr:Cof-type HAD-IIB family hydrolase [Kocuria carniphila]MCT1803541.1 Cof-type HAD-IIB family hydrolase [Kocuria carniphila]
MPPEYQLVAFDMDGTLVDSTKDLQPGTRRAFEAMRAAGTRIMLASGRPIPGLKGLASKLNLGQDLVLAGMNGSIVVDQATNREITRHPMPLNIARALIAVAKRHDVLVMIPHDDELLVEDPSDTHAQHEATSNKLSIRHVDDLTELDVKPTKVLLVGERDITDPLLDELNRTYGDQVELAYSSPLYLEATAAGIHKGSAITDYCEAEGIPLSRVMAFGDNGNDIGMLRTAGLGVAMGNGIPEAKAAADLVTTSHDDEGIARVLSRYFDVDTSDVPGLSEAPHPETNETDDAARPTNPTGRTLT